MSEEPSTNLPPVTNAAVETFGLTRHYGKLTALNALDLTAVSYTHLTLPTILRV